MQYIDNQKITYLKSFIIGSSLIIVLPFYLSVQNIKLKNYSYQNYILIAPFYFAVMNVLSLFLSINYNWSLKQRLLYISLMSPLIVITFAGLTNSYNFTAKQWSLYALRIILMHFLTYNVIIYLLEKYI